MPFVCLVEVVCDYEAESPDEHTLKTGEKFLVISKSSKDWWSSTKYHPGGEPDHSMIRLLPSSYVTTVEPIGKALVEFEYEPASADELTLEPHSEVTIYDNADSEWWIGSVSNDVGYIPCSYLSNVEIFEDKQVQDDEYDERLENERNEAIDHSGNGLDGSQEYKDIIGKDFNQSGEALHGSDDGLNRQNTPFFIVTDALNSINSNRECFLYISPNRIYLTDCKASRNILETWEYDKLTHFTAKKGKRLVLEVNRYTRVLEIKHNKLHEVLKLIQGHILNLKNANLDSPPALLKENKSKVKPETHISAKEPNIGVAVKDYTHGSNSEFYLEKGEYVEIIDQNSDSWHIKPISRISNSFRVPSFILKSVDLESLNKNEQTTDTQVQRSKHNKEEQEIQKKGEAEREEERKRQKKRGLELELEKQREREREEELERQKKRELELQLEKQKERERKEELERQKKRELELQLEKQREREREEELERQKERELQLQLDKKKEQEQERERQKERERENERQKKREREKGREREVKQEFDNPPALPFRPKIGTTSQQKSLEVNHTESELNNETVDCISTTNAPLNKKSTSSNISSAVKGELPAGFRIWTDRTGEFKTAAKFINVEAGKIILLKTNGIKIHVALKRLSARDQEFVGGIIGRRELELELQKEGSAHLSKKQGSSDQEAANNLNKVSPESVELLKTFFIKTGINPKDALIYAKKFAAERIDENLIKNSINYKILKQLNVAEGDIIRILNHFDDQDVKILPADKLKVQKPIVGSLSKSSDEIHPFSVGQLSEKTRTKDVSEDPKSQEELSSKDDMSQASLEELRYKRECTQKSLEIAKDILVKAQEEAMKTTVLREEFNQIKANDALKRARNVAREVLEMNIIAKERYLRALNARQSQAPELLQATTHSTHVLPSASNNVTTYPQISPFSVAYTEGTAYTATTSSGIYGGSPVVHNVTDFYSKRHIITTNPPPQGLGSWNYLTPQVHGYTNQEAANRFIQATESQYQYTTYPSQSVSHFDRHTSYVNQNVQYPSQSVQYPNQSMPQSSNVRYPSQDVRYPSQDVWYPSQDARYSSQDVHYSSQNNQYSSQNNQYPSQNNQYPSQNNQYAAGSAPYLVEYLPHSANNQNRYSQYLPNNQGNYVSYPNNETNNANQIPFPGNTYLQGVPDNSIPRNQLMPGSRDNQIQRSQNEPSQYNQPNRFGYNAYNQTDYSVYK